MKEKKKKATEDQLWENVLKGVHEYSNEKNRTFLTRAINELPNYSPSESAWLLIEHKLDQKKSPFVTTRNRIYIWTAIAATLVITLGVWYLINDKLPSTKFTYSEEEIISQPLNQSNDTLLNHFLEEQCFTFPDKCENPRFAELTERYQQLEEIQQTVLNTLTENPGNENMEACVRRIENDKVQLKKQLLKYFAS